MKIYKYYGGKVHEAEVRETDKMYIAEERLGSAFGWSSRFRKEDCHLSPLEAIRSVINNRVSFRSKLKEKIHEIDSDLGTLRKLEKIYNQQIHATGNSVGA